MIKKRHFFFQHDQQDCGLACLMTLIQHRGYRTSIDYLRELSGTNENGTSLYGLKEAALRVGFTAEHCEAQINDLTVEPGYFILHIQKQSRYDHYIVFLQQKKNRYLFFDPEDGLVSLTEEELLDRWRSKALLWVQGGDKLKLKHNSGHSLLKWLMPLIERQRNKLSIIAAVGCMTSILGFTNTIFIEKFIDVILPGQDKKLIVGSLALWLILLFIAILLDYVKGIAAIRLGREFNVDLISKFFKRVVFLPLSFFESRKIGDLVTRREDADQIENTVVTLFGQGVVSLFSLLIAFILFFVYDREVALINLGLLPVTLLITLRLQNKLLRSQKLAMVHHSTINSDYIDTLKGISVIKNALKESTYFKSFVKYFERFRSSIYKAQKVAIRYNLLMELASFGVAAVILTYTAMKVVSGSMEIGDFLAILSISTILTTSVTALISIYVELIESRLAFERMYELINLNRSEEVSAVREIGPVNKVKIESLSYAFPGQLETIRGIDMTIERGQLTVLVGATGSGKTTFIKLLQHFYTPDEGQVLFDNQDTAHQVGAWRKCIGYVPQDVKIFNAPLWQNIAMSDNSDDRHAVQRLISDRGFDMLPDRLPLGLDTQLGEDGVKLSGGQQQLMAFCRALFQQPAFLILDEPTAALDKHTEKIIVSNIEQCKEHMPVLMVTHKTESCLMADRIYIMDNGKITETGTAKELLANSDWFSGWQLEPQKA